MADDAADDKPAPPPTPPQQMTRVRWTRADTALTIFGFLIIPALAIANVVSGRSGEEVGRDLVSGIGLFLVWWIAAFGYRILDEFTQRQAEQEDEFAVQAEPEKIVSPAGNERTLEASVASLNAYIDRLESHIERTERVAIFVPGAIGVVATITLARLNPDVTGFPIYLGIIAAGLGIRALLDSTLCITRFRTIGMSGYGELWKVDRSYDAFLAGRISMLIGGVRYANRAAAEKRRLLRLALVEAVTGVVFLYGFALFGGFQ